MLDIKQIQERIKREKEKQAVEMELELKNIRIEKEKREGDHPTFTGLNLEYHSKDGIKKGVLDVIEGNTFHLTNKYGRFVADTDLETVTTQGVEIVADGGALGIVIDGKILFPSTTSIKHAISERQAKTSLKFLTKIIRTLKNCKEVYKDESTYSKTIDKHGSKARYLVSEKENFVVVFSGTTILTTYNYVGSLLDRYSVYNKLKKAA